MASLSKGSVKEDTVLSGGTMVLHVLPSYSGSVLMQELMPSSAGVFPCPSCLWRSSAARSPSSSMSACLVSRTMSSGRARSSAGRSRRFCRGMRCCFLWRSAAGFALPFLSVRLCGRILPVHRIGTSSVPGELLPFLPVRCRNRRCCSSRHHQNKWTGK